MLSFMDYRKFVFLCYYLVMLWRRLFLRIGMVGSDTRHVSYNVISHLTGKSNRAFGEWHDPSVEQHLSIEPLNLSVPSRAASPRSIEHYPERARSDRPVTATQRVIYPSPYALYEHNIDARFYPASGRDKRSLASDAFVSVLLHCGRK